MLNHTYTSVNNANLVDCGKKQHISSQPTSLLKDNFLGEFRTELDKKKVLANLGIATELSLVWENIKGDIGNNEALIAELDARTKYSSNLNPDIVTIADGIAYIESILGKDLDAEAAQNTRLTSLEETTTNLRTDLEAYKNTLSKDLTELNNYITNTVDVEFAALSERIKTIVSDLENINNLIAVSDSDTNALKLKVGENAGLYVENLSPRIDELGETVGKLGNDVKGINDSLDTFVKKDQFGDNDGEFNFVNQSDFSSFSTTVDQRLDNFESELEKTVKTGEDGYVKNLFVDQISNNKENTDIIITDSFEMSSAKPLDVRSVVADVSGLKNLDPNVCYAGMGVISIKESTLYILKEPAEGKVIDQDYLADTKNWKCPDDLVTQVKERTEFEELANLGQLQDHIFYYVYEDVDLVTGEKPTYEGDKDAYIEALEKWAEDAVLRPQGYVSAQWGSEIEKQLGNKATTTSVSTLERKIVELEQDFLGNASDNNSTIEELQTQVQSNTETLDKANEAISTLTGDLNSFKQTVDNTYATIESLTTDDPNQKYIFTKQSEFNAYKERHQAEIASEITTKTINTNSLNIAEVPVQVIDGVMHIGENSLAYDKDVPKIEIVANEADFENMVKEEGTYYYIEEASDRYVLSSELDTKLKQQTTSLTTLSNLIVSTQAEIGSIRDLSTDNKSTLVSAINELEGKISNLAEAIRALQDQLN